MSERRAVKSKPPAFYRRPATRSTSALVPMYRGMGLPMDIPAGVAATIASQTSSGTRYVGLRQLNKDDERIFTHCQRVTMSATNTVTTSDVPIPIHTSTDGSLICPEILKVFFWANIETMANVNEQLDTITMGVYMDSGSIEISDPNNIASCRVMSTGAFTAGGTYRAWIKMPICEDISDGCGRGIICTRPLKLYVTTASFTAAIYADFKILYKLRTLGTAMSYAVSRQQRQ